MLCLVHSKEGKIDFIAKLRCFDNFHFELSTGAISPKEVIF